MIENTVIGILAGAVLAGLITYMVAKILKYDRAKRYWKRQHEMWVKENNVKGR